MPMRIVCGVCYPRFDPQRGDHSWPGIVYCTMMVHDGWDEPGKVTVKVRDGAKTRALPVISRKGRAEAGHAIALAGYTRDGFIVQNSWDKSWGSSGFALLPYEDFLMHTTDVWVAQIGVPLSVDLWTRTNTADTTSGRSRSSREIPLAEVRPFIVDVGNNGVYRTDARRLRQ